MTNDLIINCLKDAYFFVFLDAIAKRLVEFVDEGLLTAAEVLVLGNCRLHAPLMLELEGLHLFLESRCFQFPTAEFMR